MKITERFLWIAALVLAGFVIENHSNNNANLQALLVTYDAESKIQYGQINDFRMQLDSARDASYFKGFEEGKTQAGIALAQGGSLYDYKDGYHAALTQAVDDAAVLQVSEGILTELYSLRKMVPRLLNQTESLMSAAESEGYAMDLLLEFLENEADADATYLDILDLLAPESKDVPTSTPISNLD